MFEFVSKTRFLRESAVLEAYAKATVAILTRMKRERKEGTERVLDLQNLFHRFLFATADDISRPATTELRKTLIHIAYECLLVVGPESLILGQVIRSLSSFLSMTTTKMKTMSI